MAVFAAARRAGALTALTTTLVLAGCGAPPIAPSSAPTPAPSAPAASSPAPIVTPPVTMVEPSHPSGARLAARDPLLDQWKRSAAERIHDVNAKHLFAGRPHHLLQAVIVVEVTVDPRGNVTRSKVLRSPGIGALDRLALASLKTASPLPHPPSRLVGKGALVYSETWLFDNDGRFQLRTLALPQD